MSRPDPYQDCSLCRVMRAFAFSAIGGGVAAFTARWLGFEQNHIFIIAFIGALAAVLWGNRKMRQ